MKNTEKVVSFLFEVGTLRKLARMHRQLLLTDDLSDSIASHSFRVTVIGWFLAKMENADPYKTVMMCLTHDIREARSGDHNWLQKKYVKIFEEEITKEQLGELPFNDLDILVQEFEKRESEEAIIAKDADLLDQVLLLREYEHQGSKEATIWLRGKGDGKKENEQIKRLKTKSAKKLAEAIMKENPSDWWKNLWTPENR